MTERDRNRDKYRNKNRDTEREEGSDFTDETIDR